MAEAASTQGSSSSILNTLPGCQEFFCSLRELLKNGPLSKFDHRIYKAMCTLPESTTDYLLTQDLFEVLQSTSIFTVVGSDLYLKDMLDPDSIEFFPSLDMSSSSCQSPDATLNPDAKEYRPSSALSSQSSQATESHADQLIPDLKNKEIKKKEPQKVLKDKEPQKNLIDKRKEPPQRLVGKEPTQRLPAKDKESPQKLKTKEKENIKKGMTKETPLIAKVKEPAQNVAGKEPTQSLLHKDDEPSPKLMANGKEPMRMVMTNQPPKNSMVKEKELLQTDEMEKPSQSLWKEENDKKEERSSRKEENGSSSSGKKFQDASTQKDEDINKTALMDMYTQAQREMKMLREMYVKFYAKNIDFLRASHVQGRAGDPPCQVPPPSSQESHHDKTFMQEQLAKALETLEEEELFSSNLREMNRHLDRRKRALEGALKILIEEICKLHFSQQPGTEEASDLEERIISLKSSLRQHLEEDDLQAFTRDLTLLIGQCPKEEKCIQTELKEKKQMKTVLPLENIPSPVSFLGTTNSRKQILPPEANNIKNSSSPSNILEKIVNGVLAVHPQLSKGEVLEYLFVVKTKNSNKLAGLKVDNIIQGIIELASSHQS